MTGCASPVKHLTDRELCYELGYVGYDENLLVDEYHRRVESKTITLTEDQCVGHSNKGFNKALFDRYSDPNAEWNLKHPI